MMKTKVLFLFLAAMLAVGCGGDDDGVHQPPKQPTQEGTTPKESTHLSEILSHPYITAAFVKTSYGTLASFYTENYKDADGNDGGIEILATAGIGFTEEPETKGDISLSEILIRRQFSVWKLYWTVKTVSAGDYRFKGGTVTYTKKTDGTYHVVLKGGPLVDDEDAIIENIQIEYDGKVDIGSMLEY